MDRLQHYFLVATYSGPVFCLFLVGRIIAARCPVTRRPDDKIYEDGWKNI